jgi:hypothetical protein
VTYSCNTGGGGHKINPHVITYHELYGLTRWTQCDIGLDIVLLADPHTVQVRDAPLLAAGGMAYVCPLSSILLTPERCILLKSVLTLW